MTGSNFTSTPSAQENEFQAPVPTAATDCGLAVIGPQFCWPSPIDLILTRSSSEYSALDASGRCFFRSKAQDGHEKQVLLDTEGNWLVFLTGKAFTLHDTWYAYRGPVPDETRKLFTVKESSMLNFITGLNVFLDTNSDQKHPDFHVEGKLKAREYTIYVGNKAIACGKRRHNSSYYNVHIEAGADAAFVIALLLIVDEIHACKRNIVEGLSAGFSAGVTV